MDIEERGERPERSRRTRVIAAVTGVVVLVGVLAAVAIAAQDDAPGVAVSAREASPTTRRSNAGRADAAIGSAKSTVVATTVAPPVLSPATETTPTREPSAAPPPDANTQSPPVAVAPPPTEPPATFPPPVLPSGKRVVPHPEAVGPYHTISFDPAAASPDGNAVLVRFWNGNESCYLLHDVAVSETPTMVTVTLTGGAKAGVEVCTQEAIFYEVRVTLSAPLGIRTLVSGG